MSIDIPLLEGEHRWSQGDLVLQVPIASPLIDQLGGTGNPLPPSLIIANGA